MGRPKDSLSTYIRGRLPIPGFAVMELQSWIWMLGLGCSADGMILYGLCWLQYDALAYAFNATMVWTAIVECWQNFEAHRLSSDLRDAGVTLLSP